MNPVRVEAARSISNVAERDEDGMTEQERKLRITVRELSAHPEKYSGEQIVVAGWVKTIRDQKRFAFIHLADGSNFTPIQVVAESDILENFADVVAQGTGAAFYVKGRLELTPGSKQPFEIKAEEIEIEGPSSPDYPLQPKRHSPEYLRSIAHLRPRSNLFTAVFRVRSEASYALHQFFHDRGFVYVHTPIVTTSDAEGAGDMFRVSTLDPINPPLTDAGKVDWTKDFFDRQAFLTVSGQLNAESFAQAFQNVYTFGPTFRAEHSNTTTHAAEFWMLEPEIAFADLDDVMQLAEDMLRHVIRHVFDNCPEEMAFFNKFVDKGLVERLQHVADSDFARITYTEAIELLMDSKQKFDYNVNWGDDLQTEHERYLTEQVYKRPVFVTDYPAEIKAFYMRLNDDGETVAATDCLVPQIGELIGGSQREERIDVLTEQIKKKGLREEDYDWYIDLRRYGSTKHGGFGLGFERLIMYLTGVSNIRDVTPFPRTYGSATF